VRVAGSDGLAEGSANYDRCAARDADAHDENHEEHGGGSGCGAHQEVEKNVIQSHEKQYGPDLSVAGGYERHEPKFEMGLARVRTGDGANFHG